MVFHESKNLLSVKWIGLHVAIGFLVVRSSIVAQLWCAFILLFGLDDIRRKMNAGNEAALWSGYMVAAEVILRACGGALVWEIGKYSVILFCLYGMIVERIGKRPTPLWVYLILLLLLPGILSTFTWSSRIFEDISFNASGIICLLVCTIYFYGRKISYAKLKEIFIAILYPIISLSMVLFFKTPDIESITFTSSAMFETSAGFGPNQVATVLGFGWMIILILMNLKEKVTFSSIITYCLFGFILYRALFTFSRGGNFGAILGYVSFVGVFFLANDFTVFSAKSIRSTIAVIILSLLVVTQLDNITGGVFGNRFTGKTTTGEMKDDVTSGRVEILELEWQLFKDNPIGVGTGGSKYFREVLYGDFHASHNEFGRLISEHGVFGILIIIILIFKPIAYYHRIPDNMNRAFAWMFFVLFFSTIMHSSFRITMPAFLFGLSFFNLIKNENTLYRQ